MRIGAYSIVASRARVGKNIVIGDYTQISANAVIEDDVVIGDRCKIGFPDSVNIAKRIKQNSYYKKFLIERSSCFIKKGTVVNDGATIMEQVIIGSNCRIGNNSFIRSNCRLGNNVSIGYAATIEPFVEIGDNSAILQYCAIGSTSLIGKYVFLSPGCMLAENRYMSMSTFKNRKGPVIEDYVRIGALSTIIGCRIGKFCMIGANSVIAKDLQEETVSINRLERSVTLKEKQLYLKSL
jgi:UDP-3-O-[3-hydroxymyristoyl] glucosamine N-acyltransferase